MIQSVDSVHLAGEIDKYSEKLGRTTQILLQVNIGDEAQKFGVDPADTVALVRDVSGFFSRRSSLLIFRVRICNICRWGCRMILKKQSSAVQTWSGSARRFLNKICFRKGRFYYGKYQTDPRFRL